MTTPESNRPAANPGRFTKAQRLRQADEFRAAYAQGIRAASRSFVAFVRTHGSGPTRFGLTTPRRLGKAHERNRIRRRVREILRSEYGRFPAGRDIVLNPRRSVLERDLRALRNELLTLLEARE